MKKKIIDFDDIEPELIKRGWVEDRLMSNKFISPYTKINYSPEQAGRIEDLI